MNDSAKGEGRAVERVGLGAKNAGMWIDEERRVDWSEAERVLSRGDPVMRRLIKRVGPCTLSPRQD